MNRKMNEKPEMQVVILIHGGVKCYWLTPNDTRIGSDQRYLHPDCQIYFKGSRSHRTDYAVSLALQDAKMSVRALRYHKK